LAPDSDRKNKRCFPHPPPLYQSAHGQGTGPRKDCKKGLEYATRRAGLAFHVYPHMLRHAWASRLIMAGVDRKSIQEMGGWVDGRMLDEVYAHVTVEHKVSIMQAQGIG